MMQGNDLRNENFRGKVKRANASLECQMGREKPLLIANSAISMAVSCQGIPALVYDPVLLAFSRLCHIDFTTSCSGFRPSVPACMCVEEKNIRSLHTTEDLRALTNSPTPSSVSSHSIYKLKQRKYSAAFSCRMVTSPQISVTSLPRYRSM